MFIWRVVSCLVKNIIDAHETKNNTQNKSQACMIEILSYIVSTHVNFYNKVLSKKLKLLWKYFKTTSVKKIVPVHYSIHSKRTDVGASFLCSLCSFIEVFCSSQRFCPCQRLKRCQNVFIEAASCSSELLCVDILGDWARVNCSQLENTVLGLQIRLWQPSSMYVQPQETFSAVTRMLQSRK